MRITLLVVLFAMLTSLSVIAGERTSDFIGWNDLSVSYRVFAIDGAPKDHEVITVAGTSAINNNVFVLADYGKGRTIDDAYNNQSMFSVGLGYNKVFPSGVNTYAALSFMKIKTGWVDTTSGNDRGYVLRAGIRGMITNSLELRGTVVHVDIFDDQLLELGIRYRVVKSYYVGVDLSLRDDVSSYGVVIAYQF
jgi:hypothetical protein